MPTGKKLTQEQREEIYEARMLGEKPADIGPAYGIKPATVSKIVKQQRELHEKEEALAQRESVMAGDKKNGRLVSTGNRHNYIGTCIVGGRSYSRIFTTSSSAAATRMWEEWCEELRSRGVQRKPEEPAAAPVVPQQDEPVAIPDEQKGGVVEPESKEIYVIWTKGANPRLYGAFSDMEQALGEVDRLNEVASFLVSDCVFEVESVSLKA